METVSLSGDVVTMIDQRRLPLERVYVECCSYREVASAIREMTIRGAPAIGVAAAFGLVLAAREAHKEGRDAQGIISALEEAAGTLRGTRPTAVNLFWAIDRMLDKARSGTGQGVDSLVASLREEAELIAAEDLAANRRMGAYGQALIEDGAGILTHCNAGALATAGYGTALGVIRAAHEAGKKIRVFVDETRPLLQGARLTAWELREENIPATLITDSMAGFFMQQGAIDIVLVGADRIAANGDVANKIGTYGLAVLAAAHGIPFYVVAPGSTVDLAMSSGEDITIEEREAEEVTHIRGVQVAPEGIEVANPAFDLTPHRYVTGIVTERGIIYPPYRVNLRRTFGERDGGRKG